jgi:hypothetical protein
VDDVCVYRYRVDIEISSLGFSSASDQCRGSDTPSPPYGDDVIALMLNSTTEVSALLRTKAKGVGHPLSATWRCHFALKAVVARPLRRFQPRLLGPFFVSQLYHFALKVGGGVRGGGPSTPSPIAGQLSEAPEAQGGPGRPREAQGDPGRPRDAQGHTGGPGRPREAQGDPGTTREAQGGPGRPREAQGDPRKPGKAGEPPGAQKWSTSSFRV